MHQKFLWTKWIAIKDITLFIRAYIHTVYIGFLVFNTDDMSHGGSGYPTGTDAMGCVEAIDEPMNGKPYHITINLPPLAGIYFMKVKDPKPKRAAKKTAEKKPAAKKAAAAKPAKTAAKPAEKKPAEKKATAKKPAAKKPAAKKTAKATDKAKK